MTRIVFSFLTLAIFLNPAHSAAAPKRAFTVPELVKALLKAGKKQVMYGDKRALFLGLPPSGARTRSWGTAHANPVRVCSLIVEESSNGREPKPVCLILRQERRFPEQNRDKDWHFRLRLDGSLERAISAIANLDKNGKSVEGTAVITAQDAADPAVQAQAREELDFWLAKGFALSRTRTETIQVPAKFIDKP